MLGILIAFITACSQEGPGEDSEPNTDGSEASGVEEAADEREGVDTEEPVAVAEMKNVDDETIGSIQFF